MTCSVFPLSTYTVIFPGFLVVRILVDLKLKNWSYILVRSHNKFESWVYDCLHTHMTYCESVLVWCFGRHLRLLVGGWIKLIVGFQPLMVISPTASWIRWCMQVYVHVWVNVDLSCLGRTIYTRQLLGAKSPIQFRHRWAEMNHSDHL